MILPPRVNQNQPFGGAGVLCGWAFAPLIKKCASHHARAHTPRAGTDRGKHVYISIHRHRRVVVAAACGSVASSDARRFFFFIAARWWRRFRTATKVGFLTCCVHNFLLTPCGSHSGVHFFSARFYNCIMKYCWHLTHERSVFGGITLYFHSETIENFAEFYTVINS